MNGNLVPVATNQNGVPVLFQDRNSGMFYLQTQYGLVASDANGNPLQQQQQSFGYNPQQQQQSFGYNQQQQMMPSVGGSKYGNKYGQQQQQQQTFGIGGIPNNTLPNNNVSNVTSKYGNKYGQQQQMQAAAQQQQQQQPVTNTSAQVNVVNSTYIPEGYKAQPGSEFIPLYDETTEDLDVVVDENSKTYKFIIIKK